MGHRDIVDLLVDCGADLHFLCGVSLYYHLLTYSVRASQHQHTANVKKLSAVAGHNATNWICSALQSC